MFALKIKEAAWQWRAVHGRVAPLQELPYLPTLLRFTIAGDILVAVRKLIVRFEEKKLNRIENVQQIMFDSLQLQCAVFSVGAE